VSESEEITQARVVLGRQLAARRQAAGYNQTEFAPLTGYARSTVANVETGRQKVARDFWQRCDDAVGAGGALTARFDEIESMVRREKEIVAQQAQAERDARVQRWRQIGSGVATASDPSHDLPPPVWTESLVSVQLDALALWAHDLRPGANDDVASPSTAAFHWLVAPGDDPATRADGWRQITQGDVQRLRMVRAQLKNIDNTHGGGAAFPMATAYLRHEVAPLFAGRYTELVGRALFEVTAELALDVGWMAYDAGDHRLARRYMVQALRMAHAGDNRLLGGRVLAALSHHALHLKQVPLAVDLARAARTGTARIATPRAVAMLAAMEACAQAARQNERLCTAALFAAEDALSRACSSDDDPDWLEFDEGGLRGHAARAYGDLRQSVPAQRYAEESIRLCLSDHSRTRAQRNAILARAHLARGEIEQAAAVGVRIVDDAWNLHSSLVYTEVAALAHTIKTQAVSGTDEFVARVDDLLTARPIETATTTGL